MTMSTAKSGASVPSLFRYTVACAALFLFVSSSFATYFQQYNWPYKIKQWNQDELFVLHVNNNYTLQQGYSNVIVSIDANNITFNMGGFELYCATGAFADKPAISVKNRTGVTILGSDGSDPEALMGTIDNAFIYGVKIENGSGHYIARIMTDHVEYGFYITGSSNNMFDDCRTQEVAKHAFYMSGSNNQTIVNTFINVTGRYGIYNTNSTGMCVMSTSISNAGVSGSYDGLCFVNGDNASLGFITSDGNGRNGFYMNSGSTNCGWDVCYASGNAANGLKFSSTSIGHTVTYTEAHQNNILNLDDPHYQNGNTYISCNFD